MKTLDFVKEKGIKHRTGYHLNEVVQWCFREKKYAICDPRRECPWNYSSVCDKCFHCKWFMVSFDTTFQVMGENAGKLAEFIKQFMPIKFDRQKNTTKRSIPAIEVDVRDRNGAIEEIES